MAKIKRLGFSEHFNQIFFSWAIVFTLSTNYLYIMGHHFGFDRSGSIGTTLSIVFFAAGILFSGKLIIRKYPYLLLANVVIVAVYACLGVYYSSLTFYKFTAFSLIPMVLLIGHYDEEKVVRYTCYLIPTTLFVMGDLFKPNQSYAFSQMEMGYSYAILYMLVACVIHFSFFRSKSNLYMKFCYGLGLYLLWRVILLATRGTIVSLLVLFSVMLLIRFNKKGEYVKPSLRRKLTIIISVLILIIIVINIEMIIEPLYNFARNIFEILPAFLEKTYMSVKSGDVSRGRSGITAFTMNRISEKPFLGHGAMTFKAYNGKYAYPHNSILQLLFESGFVGAALQIFYLGYGVWFMLFRAKKSGREKTAFLMLIFLSAFPMLLMSDEMWNTPAFWMAMICGGRMFLESRSSRAPGTALESGK